MLLFYQVPLRVEEAVLDSKEACRDRKEWGRTEGRKGGREGGTQVQREGRNWWDAKPIAEACKVSVRRRNVNSKSLVFASTQNYLYF